MVLLMQKFENETGETGIRDQARWPPEDEACGFLRDLQNATDLSHLRKVGPGLGMIKALRSQRLASIY
jgi:hypothetical protein